MNERKWRRIWRTVWLTPRGAEVRSSDAAQLAPEHLVELDLETHR